MDFLCNIGSREQYEHPGGQGELGKSNQKGESQNRDKQGPTNVLYDAFV